MDVKVTLDMDELRRRLCPGCREEMDRYLKELVGEALKKDIKEEKNG